jgi:multicomponent Na+:H+ antiporter subunit D
MQGIMITTVTSAADWVVILPVLLPLLGAAVLLMLRHSRDLQWPFAAAVIAGVIACDLALLLRTQEIGPLSMTMGRWLPPFGISFTADVISAAFALVAAVATLAVLVYLQMDAPERAKRDGLYSLVLLLLAGVSGSFLTGDLFNLYVWFEVMLIASFGLMVLGGRSLQLDGTVKYGFINFLATTFFLLALGLIYGLLGTLNMADVVGAAPGANPAAMSGVAALLLLAFGMKAAAFPVDAWLPASYHTPPAGVSALLAGLLTKVGVYALLRTLSMLLPASRDLLEPVLAVVAIATLLLGPMGAIAETNLRRALGFLVIGGIGAVIAGLALGDAAGLAGSAAYVIHAILTITALYLVAGLVEKATGETDSRRMGGLYATASLLSILFLVLILAVSGVPPFLGFWPKLLLVEAGLDNALAGTGADWLPAALAIGILINAWLTLIAGTRLWAHIFWRPGWEGGESEIPNTRLRALAGPERIYGLGAAVVLTGLVVVAGLLPDPLFDIARRAGEGLLQAGPYIAATGLGGVQ